MLHGVREREVCGAPQNPDERAMGSTPNGNAVPTGSALPQHFEIDRDGRSRVRIGGHLK
jgi:hypothetical protein